MKDMITIDDKKRFLYWFLERYQLKNPEAEWLLQYIATNDKLLAKTHFTNRFKRTPKAIFMSSTDVNTTAFKFYKNQSVTSEVERAFLDLYNYPEEELYLTMYFSDRARCPEYAAVMVEDEVEGKLSSVNDAVLSLEAELWLDEVSYEHRLNNLEQRIDDALIAGDRSMFLRLSKEYKLLRETKGKNASRTTMS
nr:IDEAL domain-containing protein [Bacilli bacterium]